MERLAISAPMIVIIAIACGGYVSTEPPPAIDIGEAVRQTMTAMPVPDAPSPKPLEPTETQLPTETLPPSLTPCSGFSACVPLVQIQVGMVTNVVDGDTIDVLIDVRCKYWRRVEN